MNLFFCNIDQIQSILSAFCTKFFFLYVLAPRTLLLQVSYQDRTEQKMNTEKASQDENTFPILPKWAPYHGSQSSSQNRKHILKPILTILLFGLLSVNTFQAIRGASSPSARDHSANWMDCHGNLKLYLGDMVPRATVDSKWTFNAFPKEKCAGETAVKAGSGFRACEQINRNETYSTVSVPLLPDSLRICLYPNDSCSVNATAITSITGCAPANATYYVVKPTLEEC